MEEYIQFEGYELFVKHIKSSDNETKPVIVFLHDALGCVASWKEFPMKLCEELGYEGIVYDRPGYGQSSDTTESRGINYLEKEADLVLPALLEKLNISNVILVGHSDGGTIALHYAANHTSVKALVSIAGHVMVEDVTLLGVNKIAPGLLEGSQFDKLTNYHGDKAMRLIEDWKRIWLSSEFRDWNICPQLKSITAPSLIIQGTNDEYATDNHAKKIVDAISSSTELLMIEDVGHFPHKEKEEQTRSAIINFLKGLP